MDDLISRQAAVDAIIKDWNECCGVYDADTIIHDVTDIIENLPPVQPNHNAEVGKMEIVHCKDCKQFRKPSSIVNADWGWCSGWRTPLTTFVKVDGFCHRAEKRGEADG